jgi:hypothetical protein
MNYKKQIGIIFVGILTVYLIIVLPGVVALLQGGDECTLYFNGRHLGLCIGVALLPDNFQAISIFSVLLLAFLLPLYFLREGAYLAWRKFTLWYLPIVAVLILSVGGNGSSGFNPGVGFDTESLTFFFSGLFAFVSLILIICKSIKLKGK